MPVVLTKQSKASASTIGAIPVLFLRGSGPNNKHRVLLYTPSPSPEFKALNRGLSPDAKYATRLLDAFSEGALHADGEVLKEEDLLRLQEEAASALVLDSKPKTATNTGDEEPDEEERKESPPSKKGQRGRGTQKHPQPRVQHDDEPSEPSGSRTASQLHQHLQHEKEHEKEHKKEVKRLMSEIDGIKTQVHQLAEHVNELKSAHAVDKESLDKKFKKLKSKIDAALHQPQLTTVQMAAPAVPQLATALPQAAQPAPAQAPFGLPAGLPGGYFYIPTPSQQAALGRLG